MKKKKYVLKLNFVLFLFDIFVYETKRGPVSSADTSAGSTCI